MTQKNEFCVIFFTFQSKNNISSFVTFTLHELMEFLINFFYLFSEAINCLSKAIDIYTDMGRFTIAAKHHQTIAEIYESECTDLERAIQHYEKSADYFRVCIFYNITHR